jgi:DNA end-binding protein Ku
MAQDLIKKRTKPFRPGQFHDHYTEALRSLIDAKAKHQVPVDETPDEDEDARGNVVDLVAALRRSVAQGDDTPPAGKRRKAG